MDSWYKIPIKEKQEFIDAIMSINPTNDEKVLGEKWEQFIKLNVTMIIVDTESGDTIGSQYRTLDGLNWKLLPSFLETIKEI